MKTALLYSKGSVERTYVEGEITPRPRRPFLGRVILASSLALLSQLGFAQRAVTHVGWASNEMGLQIDVLGRDLMKPKVISVEGGKILMLEFAGELERQAKREAINANGIQYLQTVWYSSRPPKVRLKLLCDKPGSKLVVTETKGGWRATVGSPLTTLSPIAPMTLLPPLPAVDKPTSDLRAETVIGDPQTAKPLFNKGDTIMTAPMPKTNEPKKIPVIKMAFFNTEIAYVLKAICVQTGASIVLATQAKATITLNVDALTIEEALRATTSAAGMAYKKAGNTYVVALASELRQALAPFGVTTTFKAPEASLAEVVAKLQEVFPYATIRTQAGEIEFRSQPDENREAARLVPGLAREIERNRPIAEVVALQRLNATDVEKMVAAIYPNLKVASSSVAAGKPGGTVLVTGPSAEARRAADLARRLDTEGVAGDGIAFQVYRLKFTSAPAVVEFLKKTAPEVEAVAGPETYSPPRGDFEPLGSALRSAAGGTGTTQGLGTGSQIQSTGSGYGQAGYGSQGDRMMKDGDRATVVVLKGPKSSVDRAMRLVEELDVQPVQVMVEVKVIETSPSFSENLGFNFSWSALQFFEVPPGSATTGNPTRPVGVGQFSRVPWSFQGIMNALVTKGEARILANPSVSVISNEDANIFIGDTIRTRVAQANGLGGQTIDVVEFPVGIILLIRPRVNADGNITMHVNPVVSTVTAVGADNIPQTSSREAETTVMVKDGETIVIGGLIRDEYSKVISEIPILSKLPIIGELFKNRTTNKRHSEVVVTITPRLVKSSNGGK